MKLDFRKADLEFINNKKLEIRKEISLLFKKLLKLDKKSKELKREMKR